MEVQAKGRPSPPKMEVQCPVRARIQFDEAAPIPVGELWRVLEKQPGRSAVVKSGVCTADCRFDSCRFRAVVAQLVECDLPKVDVAGSSPVYCSDSP